MDPFTKPRCQDMVSIPAPRDANYLLWGDQQYPLEAGLSPREAYFELDAAGVCDIRGLTQQGQAVPVATPLATTEPVPMAEPVAAVAEPASLPWSFLAVLAAVVAMVAGSIATERRRRATDSTPKPKNPYAGGLNDEH
jgi:hypothetical protein